MGTTIRVSERTYYLIIKKRGELESQDGQRRTIEGVILELLKKDL